MRLDDGTHHYHKDHTRYNYYSVVIAASVHPDDIARVFALEYLGPIADFGYHMFRSSPQHNVMDYYTLLNSSSAHHHHPIARGMSEFTQQIPQHRLFRRQPAIQDILSIHDPIFPDQWHLL